MTPKLKEDAYRQIMDFMGVKPKPDPIRGFILETDDKGCVVGKTIDKCIKRASHHDRLKYLSSWDAIIPIVEKIYATEADCCAVIALRDAMVSLNMQNAVYAIIAFIQWHKTHMEPDVLDEAVQDFIMDNYPGYHNSDDILREEMLHNALNESDPDFVLEHEALEGYDQDDLDNNKPRMDWLELRVDILEKAIKGFLDSKTEQDA